MKEVMKRSPIRKLSYKLFLTSVYKLTNIHAHIKNKIQCCVKNMNDLFLQVVQKYRSI